MNLKDKMFKAMILNKILNIKKIYNISSSSSAWFKNSRVEEVKSFTKKTRNIVSPEGFNTRAVWRKNDDPRHNPAP